MHGPTHPARPRRILRRRGPQPDHVGRPDQSKQVVQPKPESRVESRERLRLPSRLRERGRMAPMMDGRKCSRHVQEKEAQPCRPSQTGKPRPSHQPGGDRKRIVSKSDANRPQSGEDAKRHSLRYNMEEPATLPKLVQRLVVSVRFCASRRIASRSKDTAYRAARGLKKGISKRNSKRLAIRILPCYDEVVGPK